jgi:hypothetical protein
MIQIFQSGLHKFMHSVAVMLKPIRIQPTSHNKNAKYDYKIVNKYMYVQENKNATKQLTKISLPLLWPKRLKEKFKWRPPPSTENFILHPSRSDNAVRKLWGVFASKSPIYENDAEIDRIMHSANQKCLHAWLLKLSRYCINPIILCRGRKYRQA